jgi:hypothetical protein
MYICKQCNENVDFCNLKVIDLNILHLNCVDIYKSDQERLLREMAEIRKNTEKKWESLGFLEGLKGEARNNLAQLYEGQASCIINEE